MGKGDIYQETYDNIILLCIRCSRGSTRTRSGMQTSLTRNSNITSGGFTRVEFGNLLEDFKTYILITLTTQLDVLQAKQKKKKHNRLWPYFSTDAEKNMAQGNVPWMWFSFAIYTKDHDIEQYPSLLGMKVVFREVEEETKPLYLMAQHRQWQTRPPNTLQNPSSLFSGKYNQHQNSGNTWQGQPFTNKNWQPQKYPPTNPTWPNHPAANLVWQNQTTTNFTWTNSQYPTSSWKKSNNPYPS
jgi:hypothetical protein